MECKQNLWDVLPFSENICQVCGKIGHTEEHHAAIADPDATVTIENLPPELLLDVLGRLAPREIQGFRGVSKEFRELIDAPQNDTALLRSVRERNDVLKDANYFSGTPEEPSMLRFLFRYLARRGIWSSKRYTRWVTKDAVCQWAANHSPIMQIILHGSGFDLPDDLTDDELPALYLTDWLERVGEALVQAYIDTNCPDLTATKDGDTPKMCDVSTVEKFLAIVNSTEYCHDWKSEAIRFGLPTLDREEMLQWYHDIKSLKEPKIIAFQPSANESVDNNGLLEVPRSGDFRLEFPEFIVTFIKYFKPRPETLGSSAVEIDYLTEGWMSTEELRDALGLALPDLSLQGAYCLRTPWAVEALFKVKEGRALETWEKAAIFDELYLF